MKKPRDLGNDHHVIRTAGSTLVMAKVIPAHGDLLDARERMQVRRFAERLIAFCDYWNEQAKP